MNIMQYISGALEQRMMDEWAKIPEGERPGFRAWARARMEKVLQKEFGVE